MEEVVVAVIMGLVVVAVGALLLALLAGSGLA